MPLTLFMALEMIRLIMQNLALKPSPSLDCPGRNTKMIHACKPLRKPQKNWASSAIAG